MNTLHGCCDLQAECLLSAARGIQATRALDTTMDYLVKRDLVVLGFESKMRKGEKLLMKELEPNMPTGRQTVLHSAGQQSGLVCHLKHSKGGWTSDQGERLDL